MTKQKPDPIRAKHLFDEGVAHFQDALDLDKGFAAWREAMQCDRRIGSEIAETLSDMIDSEANWLNFDDDEEQKQIDAWDTAYAAMCEGKVEWWDPIGEAPRLESAWANEQRQRKDRLWSVQRAFLEAVPGWTWDISR